MKCSGIDKHLDKFLEEQLNAEELGLFKQHISSCSTCAEKVAQSQSILLNMRKLPVPRPSENFNQHVFSAVRRHYRDDQQKHYDFRFLKGFATAAVASLAIWLVSSVYIPDTMIEQPQTVSVSMQEARLVRLVFDSQADIQQVNLSISLPDNMQLEGYPGHHILSWQTSLQKGQNVLSLPIIATGYGQGELIATLNYGDRAKEFVVHLKSTLNGALNDRLDTLKSA